MKTLRTINCMPRSRFPEFHAAMNKDEWEFCEAQERRFLPDAPPPRERDDLPFWCWMILFLCAAGLLWMVRWLMIGGAW